VQWQDEGVVLATRRHGEHGLVLSVFTAGHGRHAGLVRGGAGRRARALYQPGNRLALRWRARLADQLGSFTAELLAPGAALLLDSPARLAALSAACALLEASLPERDPHPQLYNKLCVVIDSLATSGEWPALYVRFELALLAELGFGLDLGACAVTGQAQDLAFVSPSSGRAVSRDATGPYEERLLPLPPFLLGQAAPDAAQILAGLGLTGSFLRRHVYEPHGRLLPPARELLLDCLRRAGGALASEA
jgi:DNA repair protein RecO (recombination protein O)